MKHYKQLVISLIVLLVFWGSVSSFIFASSPNYGYSDHSNILYYDGYVQCQPSYNQNGNHAAQCWLRYVKADGGNDSGRIWSLGGLSQNDSRILSVSKRYWDDLNPWASVTTFSYGFTWVPHNSGIWPY